MAIDDFSTFVYSTASDATDWQATARNSFLEKPYGDVSDEDSYGVIAGTTAWLGLTAASAIAGIANTVPLIANAVGGEGTMGYLETLKFAELLDETFSSGSSITDFYQRHTQGIELTGAIVGGIAPGLGAVKLAKFGTSALAPTVQKLAATNSDHIVGRTTSYLTGLAETSSKTSILRKSYDSLIQRNGALTNLMPLERLRFAFAGGVQLGAEAMVFEAGASLMQMKNPTFGDINDLSSFVSHITTAGLFGGAFGGVISPLLWKNTRFLPAADATREVTLREAAQVFGASKQSILETPDFAQVLKSIPDGDKLAAVFDDFVKIQDYATTVELDQLLKYVPASKHGLVRTAFNELVARSSTQTETQIKTFIEALTSNPRAPNSIGEEIFNKFFNSKEFGVGVAPEQILSTFAGVNKIVKLALDRRGNVLDEKAVQQIREAVGNTISSTLESASKIGKAHKAELDKIAALGELASDIKLPGHLAPQKKIYDVFMGNVAGEPGYFTRQLADIIKDNLIPSTSAEFKALKALSLLEKKQQDIFSKLSGDEYRAYLFYKNNPLRALDPIDAKGASYLSTTLGKQFDKVTRETLAESISNAERTYAILDLVTKKYVSSPIVYLGDLANTAASFISRQNTYSVGNRVVVSDIKASLAHNADLPTTLLESQGLWTSGRRGVSTKKDFATTVSTTNNPYTLAAEIEKKLAVGASDNIITEDLTRLNALKQRMYAKAIDDLGMDEISARLYADLPIEEGVHLTRARINDFTQRRNVGVIFKAPTTLSEMELKTVTAIHQDIFTQQLAVAEKAYEVLSSLGVKLPEVVRKQMEYFRQFGLNGELPVDFANRGGAGAITNASGRMLRLNYHVTAFGSFLNGAITQLRDAGNREMAPHVMNLLRGTGRVEDLAELRAIVAKVTGGGTAWFDISAYGLPSTQGEMTFVSREVASLLMKGTDDSIDAAAALIESDPLKHSFSVNSKTVGDLLKTYSGLDLRYRNANMNLMGAKGFNVSNELPGRLYFAPTDITRSPYFVVVRDSTESGAGTAPNYTWIHGSSSANLADKVRRIEQEYGGRLEIFTKDQLELDKKLKGEFDFSQTMRSFTLDNELASRGVFSEFVPRKGEEILGEMVTHIERQAASTVRHIAKSATGDFIDNLNRLTHSLDRFAKSTHGKAFGRGAKGVTPDNTYSQLMKSFLDIGPDENADGILGMFLGVQNKVVDFTDDLATRARDFHTAARQGTPKEEALAKERLDALIAAGRRVGIDYSAMTEGLIADAEVRYGKSAFTRAFTSSVNAVSVALTLGVELINPIIQSISLPITINSAIRQLIADASPEVYAQIRSYIPTAWGASRMIGKTAKDFLQDVVPIRNFWRRYNGETLTGDQASRLNEWLLTENGKFFKEMADANLIPPPMRQMMIELGELTDFANPTMSELRQKMITATGYLAAGNRYAEMMQRIAALKVANGIADAASMNPVQRFNLLHSFATQANGVYTAAQRPGIFQGALGSAYGLYKSYTINLMQALGRHIENRDYRAILTLGALQGTTFGLRSLPGFEQLNNYVYAQNKEDGRDAYTTAEMVLGKSAGNALLYGLPSMFLNANLYSRGDLRPDTIFGDISDPVSNFPAFQQFVGVLGAVKNAYEKASNGAPVLASLADAVAHQSIWRPAARVAEYTLGEQTSKQGVLIQNIDNSWPIFDMNLYVRLAGARPFDEAVASDAYYRQMEYKADRSEAMKGLNMGTRLAISRGVDIDYEALAQDFIRNNGNPREFRNWIRARYKEMTVPQIEQMRQSLMRKGYMNFAQQMDIPSEE